MVLLQQTEQCVRSISGYYNPGGTSSKKISFLQGRTSLDAIYHKKLVSKTLSKEEAKKLAAKRHSEAERRRRLRINGQYATLRAILPNLVKMDKASVLAETIRCVKELNKTVSELEAVCKDGSMECVFPGGADKLSLGHSKGGDGGLIKVVFSCDDRSGLMAETARALRSVKARMVRTEMVTVGGRTKFVLWVEGLIGNEGVGLLKRTLKAVISKPISRGLTSRRLGLIQ